MFEQCQTFDRPLLGAEKSSQLDLLVLSFSHQWQKWGLARSLCQLVRPIIVCIDDDKIKKELAHICPFLREGAGGDADLPGILCKWLIAALLTEISVHCVTEVTHVIQQLLHSEAGI